MIIEEEEEEEELQTKIYVQKLLLKFPHSQINKSIIK